MALGELVNTALGSEPDRGVKLYRCRECNSTFERTELRDGPTCRACGADRIARARTVDSHT